MYDVSAIHKYFGRDETEIVWPIVLKSLADYLFGVSGNKSLQTFQKQ